MQAQGFYPDCLLHPRPRQFNRRFSVPRPCSPLGVDPPPPGHGLDSPNIRSPTRGSVCVGTHAQLRRYCTKALDLAVWRIDAFSFRWEGFRGYAFPPISLIPRILYKVRQDRATFLLIAPWWPKRTWFLEMITLVAGYPRILPVPRDVISQPISGTLHPWPASLHLTAWPLSERPERRQAFSERAAAFVACSLRVSTREAYIPVLRDFSTGANITGWIPVQHLWRRWLILWSLFLTRATRSPRSVDIDIAAFHTGFADGSRFSTAPSLSGLVRAFFLKRSPARKPLPAWSLPGVLEALGIAPFEPLTVVHFMHHPRPPVTFGGNVEGCVWYRTPL